MFDATFRRRTGELVGVEICLTGTPARTAEQLARALQAPGIEVLALFENRSTLRATEKQLPKRVDKNASTRLQLRLLGEIIANGKRRSK